MMWLQNENRAMGNILLPYGTNGKSQAGDNPRGVEIKIREIDIRLCINDLLLLKKETELCY